MSIINATIKINDEYIHRYVIKMSDTSIILQ